MVVLQEPAQPFAATNVDTLARAALRRDQLIVEPLMVSLPVVVRHVLIEGAE